MAARAHLAREGAPATTGLCGARRLQGIRRDACSADWEKETAIFGLTPLVSRPRLTVQALGMRGDMMSAGTATTAVFDPGVLVGEAPGFLAFKSRLAAVARAQGTTSIRGPTRSGEELGAPLVHAQARPACPPFGAPHRAALPEEPLEAELFGPCRGALP